MTRLTRTTLTARAAALLEAWRAMGEPNVTFELTQDGTLRLVPGGKPPKADPFDLVDMGR